MPTTIVLVRHGETDWNRDSRFQGHADIPLNEVGRGQARELAGLLAGEPINTVYTSSLRRASETADIVAEALGLHALPLDALREIDVGTWEGLTIDEVKSRFPEHVDWRSGWEEGENYEDVSARVIPALLGLGVQHPDEQVLGVTHAGPIRAALAFAMGLSDEEARPLIGPLRNCSVFRFALRGDILERVD
ncbi:MAG: histidine phosphatase family protein [Gaiellaceae bacterium]